MQINSLTDFFIHSLSDIYNAEKQLTRGLAKMAREADNKELVEAFKQHLEETQGQIERLDQLLESDPNLKLKRMKCHAMEGLIDEAKEVIEATDKGSVRDVALIAAAQKVEHYEIASYGSLCQLAEQLGLKEAKTLLGQTLEEEKKTDDLLTKIATSKINLKAEGK